MNNYRPEDWLVCPECSSEDTHMTRAGFAECNECGEKTEFYPMDI